jgi:hypothetical protein
MVPLLRIADHVLVVRLSSGVAWYISFRDRVLALQAIPRSAWAIDSGRVSSPLANMQSLT